MRALALLAALFFAAVYAGALPVPLPLPTVGEAAAVTSAGVAEFQTTVTTIGMDLFVDFFVIAAVVSAIAIVPALLMAWNRSRSEEMDRQEASEDT